MVGYNSKYIDILPVLVTLTASTMVQASNIPRLHYFQSLLTCLPPFALLLTVSSPTKQPR